MGCLKIIGYVLLFAFLAAVLGSVELLFWLLGLFVVAVAAYRIYKDRANKKLQSEALSEVIEVQVSSQLAQYIKKTAIALDGDGSYSFRVVGEKYRKENFKELAEYMQIDESETVALQTQLVCQPNNPHDPKAVAVTLGGYLIGFLPRYEAEPLHDYLMQYGGVAGVNSKVSFDLESEEFEVDLDLTKPFTKLDIKPFEV